MQAQEGRLRSSYHHRSTRGTTTLIKPLSRLTATHVTVAVGALYVIGFIVANVHYGRYAPVRADLLKTRYIAAAVLFCAFTIVPLAAGSYAWSLGRVEGAMRRGNATWLLRAAVIAGAYYFVWMPICRFAGLAGWFDWGFVLYYLAVVVASYTAASAAGEFKPDPKARTYVASFILSLMIAFTLFMVPTHFAIAVYPKVRPEYGGGAVWLVRLHSYERSNLSPQDLFGKTVVLIERDEERLTVLPCENVEPRGRWIQTVSLPAQSVGRIDLLTVVSLSPRAARTLTHLCRDTIAA